MVLEHTIAYTSPNKYGHRQKHKSKDRRRLPGGYGKKLKMPTNESDQMNNDPPNDFKRRWLVATTNTVTRQRKGPPVSQSGPPNNDKHRETTTKGAPGFPEQAPATTTHTVTRQWKGPPVSQSGPLQLRQTQ